MESLTRRRLTAALAERQLLRERAALPPSEAIRLLTPLQGQHAPAPHIALAARLEGFAQADLEAALASGAVVKTTINRVTLHLAAAEDYPAFAQMTRLARMRKWRETYAHLDEEAVAADLGAWLSEPRTNPEIRAHVLERYPAVPDDGPYPAIFFARTLLPLIQLPPAGFWKQPPMARFVTDRRRLPAPAEAAATVIRRYLAAFGPAAKRDVAAWSGVPQRDFADAWELVGTISYRDESGRELLDLPGAPLPPESVPLPPRFLAHWDQPLLAYADRERIIPAEVLPLQLTLSGDPTVTVDGRVAASWAVAREGETAVLSITPHVDIARSARPAIREEALRTARFCEPDAARHEVAGL